MRIRRSHLVIVAVVGVGAGLATGGWLLSGSAPARPQVRILRLVRVESDFLNHVADPDTASISWNDRLTGPAWLAEFEISVPPESGMGLSDGDIRVEIFGSDARRSIGSYSTSAPESEEFYHVSMHTAKIRRISETAKLTLPAEAERLRFTFGIRPPTRHERCLRVLGKVGMFQRFPRISQWIADRFSEDWHWRDCQQEVRLAEYPIGVVPSDTNFVLSRLGHWP